MQIEFAYASMVVDKYFDDTYSSAMVFIHKYANNLQMEVPKNMSEKKILIFATMFPDRHDVIVSGPGRYDNNREFGIQIPFEKFEESKDKIRTFFTIILAGLKVIFAKCKIVTKIDLSSAAEIDRVIEDYRVFTESFGRQV